MGSYSFSERSRSSPFVAIPIVSPFAGGDTIMVAAGQFRRGCSARLSAFCVVRHQGAACCLASPRELAWSRPAAETWINPGQPGTRRADRRIPAYRCWGPLLDQDLFHHCLLYTSDAAD